MNSLVDWNIEHTVFIIGDEYLKTYSLGVLWASKLEFDSWPLLWNFHSLPSWLAWLWLIQLQVAKHFQDSRHIPAMAYGDVEEAAWACLKYPNELYLLL
jgi:hypothetical protein